MFFFIFFCLFYSSTYAALAATTAPPFICVWGNIEGNQDNRLLGEYSYGGKDFNGNNYWKLPQNKECMNIQAVDGFVYLFYSEEGKKWEISYQLKEGCHFMECDDGEINQATPDLCKSWKRYSTNVKPDTDPFKVTIGKCPQLKCDKMVVSGYIDNFWTGCNGIFNKINDNVYERNKKVDHGFDNGPVNYWWYFDTKFLNWKCARIDRYKIPNQCRSSWDKHSTDGTDGTYLLDIDYSNNNKIQLITKGANAICSTLTSTKSRLLLL